MWSHEPSPVSLARTETGALAGLKGDFAANLGVKKQENVMPVAEGSGGSGLKGQCLIPLRGCVWPEGDT